MTRFAPTLLLALTLVACGGGTSDDDAGAGGMDAATGADGGTSDAGGADAGEGTDAGGGADAGAVDAGEGTDAGVECDSAMVDEPCAVEGAFCGGPCSDPCSFCNLLTCTGGTWNRVEVFPTPCFACGDDARCVTGEQHCVHSYSDVGGVPDSFACEDNPEACAGDSATCGCLEGELAFDECVEPNPGEVEIRYFGG